MDKINCEFCNKETTKTKLTRHQQSKNCKLFEESHEMSKKQIFDLIQKKENLLNKYNLPFQLNQYECSDCHCIVPNDYFDYHNECHLLNIKFKIIDYNFIYCDYCFDVIERINSSAHFQSDFHESYKKLHCNKISYSIDFHYSRFIQDNKKKSKRKDFNILCDFCNKQIKNSNYEKHRETCINKINFSTSIELNGKYYIYCVKCDEVMETKKKDKHSEKCI